MLSGRNYMENTLAVYPHVRRADLSIKRPVCSNGTDKTLSPLQKTKKIADTKFIAILEKAKSKKLTFLSSAFFAFILSVVSKTQ